jgi:hypothetical protein
VEVQYKINQALEATDTILGKGFEHICRKCRAAISAIKEARPFIGGWQDHAPEKKLSDWKLIKEAIHSVRDPLIRLMPSIFHENVTISSDNHTSSPKSAIETPFLKEYNDLMLTYGQIIESPEIRTHLINLLKICDELYKSKDNPRGLDPFGGECMIDAVKVVRNTILQVASKYLPQCIQSYIREKTSHGVQGIMRNILASEINISLTDAQKKHFQQTDHLIPANGILIAESGMHDLSKDNIAPMRWLLNELHILMTGVLVEILLNADKNIQRKDLAYNGSERQRRISMKLFAIVRPHFEAWEKNEKAKTATKSTDC